MNSRRNLLLALGAVVLLVGLALLLWPRATEPAADAEPHDPRAPPANTQPSTASAAKAPGTAAVVIAPKPADAGTPAQQSAAPFIAAKWGNGLMDLGRERPSEANPEAPMSLAIGPGGAPVVLDQVNGRLVRYDASGHPVDALPLTVRAPQDLAVAKDGSTVVLDRLADKSVAVMDKTGKLVGELPVEGKGIEEGGGVTGVFVDGDDVYVEREHGPLVKVGDTSGKPDPERPEIPGRPSRDGKSYLIAGLIDAETGRIFVSSTDRATEEHRYTRELRLPGPAHGILLLDTDQNGVVYVASLVERVGAAPPAEGKPPNVYVQLVCLEPVKGQPVGSAELPPNLMPEETFRDFAVLDGGGVLYAVRSEQGVSYQRYDCR